MHTAYHIVTWILFLSFGYWSGISCVKRNEDRYLNPLVNLCCIETIIHNKHWWVIPFVKPTHLFDIRFPSHKNPQSAETQREGNQCWVKHMESCYNHLKFDRYYLKSHSFYILFWKTESPTLWWVLSFLTTTTLDMFAIRQWSDSASE